MGKKEKNPKAPETNRLFLKKVFSRWFQDIQLSFQELKKESAFLNEVLFYLPLLVAILFFYHLNRIGYFYHNFGNYGAEEYFLQTIVPLVDQIRQGHYSGLSLGFDGPGYPLTLALKCMVGQGDVFRNALFLNVLFGTGSLLFSYYLFRRLFNTRTALGVLLLMATNVSYFEFTYTACSGALFVFWVTVALYLFFSSSDENCRYPRVLLFLSGMVSALSAMTQATGLMLLPFAFTSFYYMGTHGEIKKQRLQYALAYGSGFALIFLSMVFWVRSQSAQFFRTPLLIAKGNALVVAALKNLYLNFFSDAGGLLGWFLGVFLFLGLAVLFLSESNGKQRAFYALGGLIFAMLSLMLYNRFYSLIMVLFYLPLLVSVFGMGHYKKILERRLSFVLLGIFILLSGVSIYQNVNAMVAMSNNEPRHLIEMANGLLRQPAKNRGPILSSRPLLAQRAQCPFVSLPDTIQSLRALIQYAQKQGVRYFLADFPEYRAHRFLWFMANPEIPAPLGMKEVMRKGTSVLYEMDYTRLENPAVPAYSGLAMVSSLADSRVRPASELPAFLKSQMHIRNVNELSMPPYQILTQYKLKGYSIQGVVFKGPLNELVTANLYVPAQAEPQKVRFNEAPEIPACVILAGSDTAGKKAIQVLNYAEALVQSGFAVIAIDWPGCGERKAPGQSHSAFFQYEYADGYAPAELFIYETILAKNLLATIPNCANGKTTLIAFDDDGYTALYSAILDTAFHEVLCVGGLVPLPAAVNYEVRPYRSLFYGIGASYPLDSLIRLVQDRHLIYASLSPEQNRLAGPIERFKGQVIRSNQESDFIKEGYGRSILSLSCFQNQTQLRPADFRFRSFSEQEQSLTFTIGPENFAANNPTLATLMNELILEKNKDELFLKDDTANRFDAAKGAVLLEHIKSDSLVKYQQIHLAMNTGLPTLMTEISRIHQGDEKKYFILPYLDDHLLNNDSTVETAALGAGYTVLRLPLYPRVRNHGDRMRILFDHALMGINERHLMETHLLRAVAYAKGRPIVCHVRDPLTATVLIRFAETFPHTFSKLIVGPLSEPNFASMRTHSYSGYDGELLPTSEIASVENFFFCIMSRNYESIDIEEALRKLKLPTAFLERDSVNTGTFLK